MRQMFDYKERFQMGFYEQTILMVQCNIIFYYMYFLLASLLHTHSFCNKLEWLLREIHLYMDYYFCYIVLEFISK